MKRIIIALIISIVTILVNSCETGCGCPGGAGYSQNQTTIYAEHKV